MSQLRETVIIKTLQDTFIGHLFVGHDGLPQLAIIASDGYVYRHYRPATFPAAWSVEPTEGFDDGFRLLNAWNAISKIQTEIAKAQRAEEAQDADRA